MMGEEWHHAGRVFNPESPGDGGPIAVAVVVLVTVLAVAIAWGHAVRWHGMARGER